MRLLTTLCRLQVQARMSDRKFAKLLGASVPTWCDTKRGDAPVGPEIVIGSWRAFKAVPQMKDDVLEALDKIPRANKRRSYARREIVEGEVRLTMQEDLPATSTPTAENQGYVGPHRHFIEQPQTRKRGAA